MSKQISFFLTPTDVATLESRIGDVGPFVVLAHRSSSKTPRQLRGMDAAKSGGDSLFLYLVRPEDLPLVVMNKVVAQNYWSVDVLLSPVIEFTKSFFDEQILRLGRAYVIEKYFGPDELLVQKSDEFKAWAALIFKCIKRTTKRDGLNYFGTNAASWASLHPGQLDGHSGSLLTSASGRFPQANTA